MLRLSRRTILSTVILASTFAVSACSKSAGGDSAPAASASVAATAAAAAPSAAVTASAAAATATAAPAAVHVAQHPAYLHALADLREARGNLERKGGNHEMKWDEHDAIGAVDRAIHEIKVAAIDDGRNPNDIQPVDGNAPYAGRLHKALAALRAARADVDKEEDNAYASGLKARALVHINEAIRSTEMGVAAIH